MPLLVLSGVFARACFTYVSSIAAAKEAKDKGIVPITVSISIDLTHVIDNTNDFTVYM
jgi:hypothetical protein